MRPTHILAGLVLLAAYLSLGEAIRFRAELGRAFHYVGWREGLFWISHHLLALPGLLLLAHGLAPFGRGAVEKVLALARGASALRWRLAGGLFVALLLAWATFGRALLLLDLPITDDESGVLFGARMWLEGRLSVALPEPAEALPLLFTYLRGGEISSMDYPGGIAFMAAGVGSGLGSAAWALAAAVGGLATAWAGGMLGGRLGALAAAGVWLLSPMVQTLSLTEHPHLLSRTFVALALACYLLLVLPGEEGEGGRRAALQGLALGLAAGGAFLTRPIEAVCLLTPAAVHLLLLALHPGPFRAALGGALGGFLPAAAAFAWYNARVSGLWFLPPRFAPGASSYTATEGPWELLGLNLGFNVMMLMVFFLGPVGVALVYLGLRAAAPPARRVKAVLGSGVLLHLLLALFHADTGIHLVGPIHYSETAVPLALLAVLGLGEAGEIFRRLRLRPGPALALVPALAAGLLLFTAVHARTLRAQAEIQRVPREAIARAVEPPAVVVADPQHELWELRPEMARVRSWAVEYPHPDPFLRQDVLLVYPTVPPEVLDQEFPERRIYRMTYSSEGDPVRIRLLREAREPREHTNHD